MGRLIALLLLCALLPAAERRIALTELQYRIEGGWAGQMIGVSFGAPTEFRSLGKTIDGDLPVWSPDKIRNALDQDDLYVDMTFAQVLDDIDFRIEPDFIGLMAPGLPRAATGIAWRAGRVMNYGDGILTGTFTNVGGKAGVYLDGKLDKSMDTYHEGRGTRADESLWHVFGLKPGSHTVRLVVLGEPYPGSQGSEVIVRDMVVFE